MTRELNVGKGVKIHVTENLVKIPMNPFLAGFRDRARRHTEFNAFFIKSGNTAYTVFLRDLYLEPMEEWFP